MLLICKKNFVYGRFVYLEKSSSAPEPPRETAPALATDPEKKSEERNKILAGVINSIQKGEAVPLSPETQKVLEAVKNDVLEVLKTINKLADHPPEGINADIVRAARDAIGNALKGIELNVDAPGFQTALLALKDYANVDPASGKITDVHFQTSLGSVNFNTIFNVVGKGSVKVVSSNVSPGGPVMLATAARSDGGSATGGSEGTAVRQETPSAGMKIAGFRIGDRGAMKSVGGVDVVIGNGFRAETLRHGQQISVGINPIDGTTDAKLRTDYGNGVVTEVGVGREEDGTVKGRARLRLSPKATGDISVDVGLAIDNHAGMIGVTLK